MLRFTNLNLSRLHRVFIVLFFKPEYKISFLKLHIIHQSLSGAEFEKSLENVIKEQSSINKVLNKTFSL